MPMYRHLYSHVAHFMRYNRRKWKPLIGWNWLAQCQRVLDIHTYTTVWTKLFANKFIIGICSTEGELTLCWRFDDELWIWFRNVTFIQLCIFCFFDRKSGQYVSKHRHFTMVWYVKGISAKNLASKRAISVFFVIILPQQKTRFRHVHLYGRPCSETSMSMFRNVLVININAIKGTKVVIIYNV